MSRHESRSTAIDTALSRRSFIKATAALAAVATSAASQETDGVEAPTEALIDTHVALGQWPFRHLPLADKTANLVAELRKHGVTQAWAGSLDALLHKDIAAVNSRLAEQCQQHGDGLLVPIGALNLKLPDWEEDLRRCDEVHRMPGVRLHPNYHGYKLNDPAFVRLLEIVAARKMLVQITVIMEEERTLHPLVNVPPTDTAPLSTALKKLPTARVQLLNAFRTLKPADAESLASLGVRFEIAMLEGVSGVEQLLKRLPLSALCFGSYAPVFYFDSARLKLQESELGGMQRSAICSENAVQLLTKL